MSKTSILIHTNAVKTNQDNIASKNAWGTKKRETLFVNSVVGGGISYVTSNTRNTNNIQGNIVSTGINSDLAMQGDGMFVVANSTTGAKVFTRRGDFRQNDLGFWKNGADQLLFANQLDKNEKLPANSSLLSALTAVNFANVKGDPKPTTTVSIAMNFNASQEALRGAGVKATVNKSGINSGAKISETDVLFSENLLNFGGLNLGDSFTFTSGPGIAKKIEYGGLAIAAAPTASNPIYGATKVADKFKIGLNANEVAEGTSLKITLSDGANFLFSVAKNAQEENKTFNDIRSLANAINKVGGLNAKIDATSGNLYIASVNPDLGMTFENGGGGAFVEKFGLINVLRLADAQGLDPDLTQRFNNLKSLNDAANSKPDVYGIKATFEDGSLRITSLYATDRFTIDGSSLGKRSFKTALLGNNTEKERATVQISSPSHGLAPGDLVRITGMAALQVPPGIYAVGSVNNDAFNIYLLSSNPGAAVAGGTIADGLPAMGASVNVAGAGGGTWQKIPGQTFDRTTAPITATGAGANALLTIDAGAAHGLVVGDVVLISNGGTFNVLGAQDVNIPDGYYIVQAIAGTTFQIKSLSVAAANVFPARALDSITYQKVGKSDNAGGLVFANGANGIGAFDTANVFTTVGHIGTNKVTLNMSSNNYKIGDMIRFKGLPVPYVIDGITIRNDYNYKVDSTAAGTITIETDLADGVAGNGLFNSTYTTAAAATLANLGGGNLQIDNVSRLLRYFNITENAGKEFDPIYDPAGLEKSLFGNEKLTSAEVFTYSLSLFDSLGENYNLRMKFAKLGENAWAVEVGAEADPLTGQFNIQAAADGQITNGVIMFDEDGQFLDPGSLAAGIPIVRRNGSAETVVIIDWKNELAKVKTGKVSQYSKPGDMVNVELVQQDGQASGNLVNLEVDETGYIIGTFDSGQIRKLYQIPVALFANVNGLRAGVGGTFEVTRESGEVLLKSSMSGGAGKVLGGVLEASNIDTTEELLSLQDLANDIRANARAVNVTNKNINTILSELQ